MHPSIQPSIHLAIYRSICLTICLPTYPSQSFCTLQRRGVALLFWLQHVETWQLRKLAKPEPSEPLRILFIKFWSGEMQPLSGNERLHRWTYLTHMSLVLHCACHATCIFAHPLQMPHACQHFWNCYKTLTFCSLLARCRILCACHTRAHPNFKKCSETTVFDTFDFQMCFAPQRRALFQHLNFQKCSGAEVFCTFLSRNVLRAITACIFSSSELPKVLREWCVFWL